MSSHHCRHRQIGQMSSNHYRRRQMSSNQCQPLPPELVKCPATTAAKLGRCPPTTTAKANVLQLLPTTTARISQMQNLITNDGFTYIQPLLLKAAGSLREFPSCSSIFLCLQIMCWEMIETSHTDLPNIQYIWDWGWGFTYNGLSYNRTQL